MNKVTDFPMKLNKEHVGKSIDAYKGLLINTSLNTSIYFSLIC